MKYKATVAALVLAIFAAIFCLAVTIQDASAQYCNDCEDPITTVEPTPTPEYEPFLPQTGSNIDNYLLIAGVFVFVGAMLVIGERKWGKNL